MPSAAIDACCLIDLLASGHAEAILRATGYTWYLPSTVHGEVQHVRQHDPAQQGQFLRVPVDLSPLIASGLLTPCDPGNPAKQERYVHFATLFRSDGEAMCIALAEQRGWSFASDDRKAIRIAQQAGLTVVSCPELLKCWAATTTPDEATLRRALLDIETLAQFRPYPALPEHPWWVNILARTAP